MAGILLAAQTPDVALTGGTARTIAGVKAPANQGLLVDRVTVSFDGTTSTAEPVLVEFCHCTFATKSPGTNSSSITPAKLNPLRAETVQSTAAHTWTDTNEPTVVTAIDSSLVPAFQGSIDWRPPSGPIEVAGGKGFTVRCNAPANVNAVATIHYSE